MEVEVKNCQKLFRPCRWINHPFVCIIVSAQGVVAVAAADLKAEDGCVPVGAVVDREVGSSGVCCHVHIGLVCWLGGDAVI